MYSYMTGDGFGMRHFATVICALGWSRYGYGSPAADRLLRLSELKFIRKDHSLYRLCQQDGPAMEGKIGSHIRLNIDDRGWLTVSIRDAVDDRGYIVIVLVMIPLVMLKYEQQLAELVPSV